MNYLQAISRRNMHLWHAVEGVHPLRNFDTAICGAPVITPSSIRYFDGMQAKSACKRCTRIVAKKGKSCKDLAPGLRIETLVLTN